VWVDLKGVVNLVLGDVEKRAKRWQDAGKGRLWPGGGGKGGSGDFSFIDRRKRKKRMLEWEDQAGGGGGGGRKRIKRGD
jgi:hypothetical protein